MTWWRRLLGLSRIENRLATPKAVETVAGPKRVTIDKDGGRIVSVREIDFIGQCATSPNGRFTLLWRDRAIVNDSYRGGRYVLIDNGHVVLDEEMARPQHGKATNGGVCVLKDWESSDELSGTFRAFASDGRALLTRSFAANPYNNGLSGDGRLRSARLATHRARPTAIFSVSSTWPKAVKSHAGRRNRDGLTAMNPRRAAIGCAWAFSP
jgi:hypothetical protein